MIFNPRKWKLYTMLFIVGLVACLPLFFNKTYIYTALQYTYPGIEDASIFYNDTLTTKPSPPFWKATALQPISHRTQAILEQWETDVFLVAKGQDIRQLYVKDSAYLRRTTNSFSMAKSVVSLGVGIALQQGSIKSVEQPIKAFIPEWSEDARGNITILQLLNMTSGLDWDETYTGLWNTTTEAYYGRDVLALVLKTPLKDKPGDVFEYKGCDTQLLCYILERSTGMRWTEWLSLNLWQPSGMESTALWSLDHEGGNPKAYCCLHATPFDYAKLGYLINHNGKINNVQVVPESYIQTIKKEIPTNTNQYAYQFWLLSQYKGYDILYMRGILGQFVVCIPEKDIVMVRIGNERSKEKINGHYKEMLMYIDEALQLH
jgi:CubicO group peptidase (beta-lactamase class C family)